MRWWSRIVVEHPWMWITAWVIAAGAVWLPAPRIPTLLQDDAHGFLPPDSPSQRAAAILRREFPDAAPVSRAVVVAARDAGLTSDDKSYLAAVARTLAARSDDLGWRVRAAALSPYLQRILESPDAAAAVIAVDLPAEMLTQSSVRRVREIQGALAAHPVPAGLQVEITGAAAMAELLDANAKRDVDRTTLWAFAAVAVILLFIYRSPIAMLLPLVSIALALMVALGAVGWAASSGWPLNGLVEMFMIVLVVGAGVDYCLFLFARFREELALCGDGRLAVERALIHAGPAVLASAGTVAAGLTTLVMARNRDLYTSGPTIAFALAVATFAVLSLTPALMSVAGVRLIRLRASTHPVRRPDKDGVLWQWAAQVTTRFPAAVALVALAVLTPAAILGQTVPSLYDTYEEYPADSSFVRGARLYQKHFFDSRGVSEMTVLVSSGIVGSDAPGRAPLRKMLDELAASLRRDFPVAYQRDLRHPLGLERGENRADSVGDAVLGLSLISDLIAQAYIGKSGAVTRIDLGVFTEPRSVEAMQLVKRIRTSIEGFLSTRDVPLDRDAAAPFSVDVAGEAAVYADMRDVRSRDFRIVAFAASVAIYAILVALIRAPVQAVVLLLATFITYLATYGATFAIVHSVYGLKGLSWQVNFLLFIIIMSLGQDYNIFVVARIREELSRAAPRQAIAAAIRRTGKVVSSCGIIMAATFASMFSGSLLVLKEFAIALPLGILIDTFIVRPLLVPALILLLAERKRV